MKRLYVVCRLAFGLSWEKINLLGYCPTYISLKIITIPSHKIIPTTEWTMFCYEGNYISWYRTVLSVYILFWYSRVCKMGGVLCPRRDLNLFAVMNTARYLTTCSAFQRLHWKKHIFMYIALKDYKFLRKS